MKIDSFRTNRWPGESCRAAANSSGVGEGIQVFPGDECLVGVVGGIRAYWRFRSHRDLLLFNRNVQCEI